MKLSEYSIKNKTIFIGFWAYVNMQIQVVKFIVTSCYVYYNKNWF